MNEKSTKLFIRGGQTFLHNIRMFTQVGKKIMSAFGVIIILLSGAALYCNTSRYERYIGVEYIKAFGSSLIDDHSSQMIRAPNGKIHLLSPDLIIKAPLVVKTIKGLEKTLLLSVLEGVVSTPIVMIFIVVWLYQRGKKQSESSIVRGSDLVDGQTLEKLIKKKGKVSPYKLAGVSLPYGSERQHIQIVGTTGSGKTAVIQQLLTEIRAKGDRAIIYDKGGTYLSKFYREDQDIILNPLDLRGKAWDVWAECEDKADLEALVEAIIPMPVGNTMDPFWIKAARMIFVSTAHELRNHPERSNLMLLQYLLTADLGKIHDLLRHTEAESLVSEKVQKTALNVKTVMATYLKSLLYLKNEGEVFSIRNWILNDNGSSFLFISSDGRKHATLTPLISAWMNTATKELLGLKPSQNRRIWFSLDEIDSLHVLPFLSGAQAEGRKFGGSFLLGYHGASQLRTTYGYDGATKLSNLASTRLFLRQPEEADASYASKNIGDSEIEEVNESISYGANTMRDGISVSKQKSRKPLVLPIEIQTADDLTGYLRVKGDFPAAKVKIPYVDYPIIHEEFIPRVLEEDPLRQKVEKLVDTYSDPFLVNTDATSKNEDKTSIKSIVNKENEISQEPISNELL